MPTPCCPMTLPAVLLSSLLLNSLVLSSSMMMHAFASTVCLPRRVVCRSSVDAAAIVRPRKRSGTVVGACRAKRSLPVASAVAQPLARHGASRRRFSTWWPPCRSAHRRF